MLELVWLKGEPFIIIVCDHRSLEKGWWLSAVISAVVLTRAACCSLARRLRAEMSALRCQQLRFSQGH